MALSLLFLTSLLASGIQAGSHVFQPPLQAPAMVNLRSNATNAQRRWVGVQAGPGDHQTHLWPNGVVTYAIASTENEEDLVLYIRMALGDWHDAGLPTSFQWDEVELAACAKDRKNCLMVYVNKMSHWSSTIGVPPATEDQPGPTLHFDANKLDLDPEDIISTMAHEMGHAWGLYHEHQNPKFWSKKYNANEAFDGTIFSSANFYCTELKDYQPAVKRVQDSKDAGPNDVEELCTRQEVAEKYNFIAAALLPINPSRYPMAFPGEDDDQDIDWDSIMIYESRFADEDSILRKPDQTDIERPKKPTTRDAAGLVTLYGRGTTDSAVRLLNDPSNPAQSRFNKIACST